MERENAVDNKFVDEERKFFDVAETEEFVIVRKNESPKDSDDGKAKIFPFARSIFRRSRGIRGRNSLGIF